MRLDKYLVKSLDIETRSKAQQLIESGCVSVDDITVYHKRYDVKEGSSVVVKKADTYVSRGAYKMLGAVVSFQLDFNNKVVLDVGSSTGGFTQIALLNGAKHVYCVDVGKEQLHKSLRNNDKVTVYEETNLKDMRNKMFKSKINIILADLSFISCTALLDTIASLFKYKVQLVLLIKPQFELPRDVIKKYNGIIKLYPLHRRVVNNVADYARKLGFKIINIVKSPIEGKDGNTEFFAYMEWK